MVTIKYHPYSPEKRERRERIQLVLTGFTLFILLMDTSPGPSMTMTVIRIFAAALGFAHVMFALRLEKVKALLRGRYEKIMAVFAGLVLITGGVVLRLEGSNAAYLVQIIVGFFYLFGLPVIIRRTRDRYLLTLDKEGLSFRNNVFTSKNIAWDAVTAARLADDHLSVTVKNRTQPFTFYCNDKEQSTAGLQTVIKKYFKGLTHPGTEHR